jgi:hypothetical protein
MKTHDKTNFMLEIDQKSSSTVFMSILLGDEELASKCNLTSISNSDPATILMNKFESYYKGYITDSSMSIIKNNRKIHKYLLMCYCYNQGYYGRTKDIREYISSEKDINHISLTYPTFIDKVFNNLSVKKNKLNNIIRYYLENSNNSILIDTLDGSRVSWYIFITKKEPYKKKYFCNG